jgi:hypothetical protein
MLRVPKTGAEESPLAPPVESQIPDDARHVTLARDEVRRLLRVNEQTIESWLRKGRLERMATPRGLRGSDGPELIHVADPELVARVDSAVDAAPPEQGLWIEGQPARVRLEIAQQLARRATARMRKRREERRERALRPRTPGRAESPRIRRAESVQRRIRRREELDQLISRVRRAEASRPGADRPRVKRIGRPPVRVRQAGRGRLTSEQLEQLVDSLFETGSRDRSSRSSLPDESASEMTQSKSVERTADGNPRHPDASGRRGSGGSSNRETDRKRRFAVAPTLLDESELDALAFGPHGHDSTDWDGLRRETEDAATPEAIEALFGPELLERLQGAAPDSEEVAEWLAAGPEEESAGEPHQDDGISQGTPAVDPVEPVSMQEDGMVASDAAGPSESEDASFEDPDGPGIDTIEAAAAAIADAVDALEDAAAAETPGVEPAAAAAGARTEEPEIDAIEHVVTRGALIGPAPRELELEPEQVVAVADESAPDPEPDPDPVANPGVADVLPIEAAYAETGDLPEIEGGDFVTAAGLLLAESDLVPSVEHEPAAPLPRPLDRSVAADDEAELRQRWESAMAGWLADHADELAPFLGIDPADLRAAAEALEEPATEGSEPSIEAAAPDGGAVEESEPAVDAVAEVAEAEPAIEVAAADGGAVVAEEAVSEVEATAEDVGPESEPEAPWGSTASPSFEELTTSFLEPMSSPESEDSAVGGDLDPIGGGADDATPELDVDGTEFVAAGAESTGEVEESVATATEDALAPEAVSAEEMEVVDSDPAGYDDVADTTETVSTDEGSASAQGDGEATAPEARQDTTAVDEAAEVVADDSAAAEILVETGASDETADEAEVAAEDSYSVDESSSDVSSSDVAEAPGAASDPAESEADEDTDEIAVDSSNLASEDSSIDVPDPVPSAPEPSFAAEGGTTDESVESAAAASEAGDDRLARLERAVGGLRESQDASRSATEGLSGDIRGVGAKIESLGAEMARSTEATIASAEVLREVRRELVGRRTTAAGEAPAEAERPEAWSEASGVSDVVLDRPLMWTGAAVLLVSWAVTFYVKTGDLRLTLGGLVFANFAGCAAILFSKHGRI